MAADDPFGGQDIEFAGLHLHVPHHRDVVALAQHLVGIHGTKIAWIPEEPPQTRSQAYLRSDMINDLTTLHTIHHELMEGGGKWQLPGGEKLDVPAHSREDRSPG